MTLAAEIASLLSHDNLADALEAAKAKVRATPADTQARNLYIDLLTLAGDYERADAQCNLASTLTPQDAMGFAMLRKQLRGMAARDAWFRDGAAPQFPEGPNALDQAAMKVGVMHREGGDAASPLADLETERGERPMIWNGLEVGDLRDLDDRAPHALEVIMTGGNYLWIDFARIATVTVEPIARPRDLAFRRAELVLIDGASAPALLPAIYAGTGDDAALRLGRRTDWVEEPTGITTGRGQRCLLAGDEIVSFHDVSEIAATQSTTARVVANG